MKLIKYDDTLGKSLGEMNYWLGSALGDFIGLPSPFNRQAI